MQYRTLGRTGARSRAGSALPPRPVTATPLTAHSYVGQTAGAPLAARVLNPDGGPGVGAAATVATGLPYL